MLLSCRPKATFRAHRKAHEAVIDNEYWYGDGRPWLDVRFGADATKKRRAEIVKILRGAAKRSGNVGNRDRAYTELADKLEECRRRDRCGSLACPMCLRAFQRANTAAQEVAIRNRSQVNPNKKLVFVTIIPRDFTYAPGSLDELDIFRARRALGDALKKGGIKGAMIAHADFSWERRGGSKYFQLHWHATMWARDEKALEAKLNMIFPGAGKPERPIDVTKATNLDYLVYQNKVIKIIGLLRNARRQLPELLMQLDRIDPLDLMVLRRFSIKSQSKGFELRSSAIKKPEKRTGGRV